MFKDVPHPEPGGDPVAFLVEQMDTFGIEKGMVGVGFDERSADSVRALKEHPDRFFGSYEVNPNRGMDGVRELIRAVEELGVKAATAFPAGMNPQVPINDAKFFPLYAKCIELDIPICVSAGVPGTTHAVRAAVRGVDRRGVLVLPRAEVRDARTAASRGPISRRSCS